MIALIVILAVAAVALGAWSASTTLATNAGSSSKRGIRAMEDYQVADVREQEMLESVGDRVFAPVGARRSPTSPGGSRPSATSRTSSARSCSPATRPATRSTVSSS